MAAIPDVTSWTVNPMVDTHTYATATVAGVRKRIIGHADWTATVEALAQGSGPDPAALVEGAGGTLALYEDGSQYWSGVCVCQSVTVTVPIDDGGPVTYTYTFEGNGALTEAGGSGTAPFSSQNGNATWT